MKLFLIIIKIYKVFRITEIQEKGKESLEGPFFYTKINLNIFVKCLYNFLSTQ